MSARIYDSNDWFSIWLDDREAMDITMTRNLLDDIENGGYSPRGQAIQRQFEAIKEKRKEFGMALEKFKTMSEADVNRWCFYDLKQRGAI